MAALSILSVSDCVFMHQVEGRLECGASIICYTMKSGACYSVQENVLVRLILCLSISISVRMWSYTGSNNRALERGSECRP